ncbi:hypothetical protein [Metabacillus niabensis]|uniref:hypothetical protein n=1 Tax=Metabacillus niabensis TaxID=324854 RepID=UPI0039A14D19
MIRKNIGFKEEEVSEYGIKFLKKKQKEYGDTQELGASETIERIFKEHEQMAELLKRQDILVEKIYERFKKDLDVIRVRTGYADKNTRIGLELWNGFIFTNDQQNYITTDEYLTKPVQVATQKVESDIASYRQRKLEREKKNKM